MTKKRARLYILLLFVCSIGTASALTLFALRTNISYFRTPSEIVAGTYPEHDTDRAFRLGGLVERDSLHHKDDATIFIVTDLKHEIIVRYHGAVPDLFREGQGVVAEGHMGRDGTFTADTLLAKHDEKYMPPEVAKELKANELAGQK